MTNRIEINPAIMQGEPVIRGTGLPVQLLLRKLAEGMTTPELLGCHAYRRLREDDVRAALDYAAGMLANETFVIVGSQ